ncbi:cell wall mannoprotein 1 family protein [Aspergillus ibericus CBS 121593]|uniref:Cell wall mannoprotein 1 n=1 Tax=Aspergillus ibericus CBS 121593 TaxID=1448316 RepID=A0A395GN69_9EURO|nr:hypothetical protein BO80DRAFT_505042 [Aspergillus ibericus CBS 121593]RAK96929.1 hypothetical protein BO80DRAFT_505042 [Aspergillus ibericus CBS 121593]
MAGHGPRASVHQQQRSAHARYGTGWLAQFSKEIAPLISVAIPTPAGEGVASIGLDGKRTGPARWGRAIAEVLPDWAESGAVSLRFHLRPTAPVVVVPVNRPADGDNLGNLARRARMMPGSPQGSDHTERGKRASALQSKALAQNQHPNDDLRSRFQARTNSFSFMGVNILVRGPTDPRIAGKPSPGPQFVLGHRIPAIGSSTAIQSEFIRASLSLKHSFGLSSPLSILALNIYSFTVVYVAKMKFTAALFTMLATSVMATPAIVERDASAITDVLSQIQTQVQALDSAINAYSGGDPSKVESASTSLVSDINSGVTTVNKASELSATDALTITGPVQDVTKEVQTTISDLIAKKSQFVAAGSGGTVYSQLEKQYTASKNLADAITSKVPSSLSSIASSLASGITDAIQKGVDAYKDAANSSPASSSEASSATSAATSATSAASAATSATEATTESSSAAASTSSSPVIPAPATSAAATPSGSASASASASATPSLFTGAAPADRCNFVLGGAVAAAAMAMAA